ncbi:MAG: HDIG domain-containing protein [Phycisphaerae bacterium]|nr:HDIG domain-containing protein [Phycisphaerae bacterium]
MIFFKKKNPRRDKVRKDISAQRIARLSSLANPQLAISAVVWLIFTAACSVVVSFEFINTAQAAPIVYRSLMVALLSIASAVYIYHYQKRVITNNLRLIAIAGLFLIFITAAKFGVFLTNRLYWATATAAAVAIILTIAYEQRFAIGMSFLYCFFAFLATDKLARFDLFTVMCAAAITCCFSLREIRTRMKLLEVSAITAAIVFLTSAAMQFVDTSLPASEILSEAGTHAAAVFFVGLLIQALLPLIEKTFKIATSMTLLDYTDANQPLLKKLAMEAPGTFSHCLLVGSIAETAAEAIGRNGLLCRVGAYYHDIGKINKPGYFIENTGDSQSPHDQLAPTMSQLVIVGHVKDGIELAKEYHLPAVIRQFIETHHGTTLVEYFYNQAKKNTSDKQHEIAEAEFRYDGPKPRTKEAAIVMLSDTIEGAVRSLAEITPAKIETVVHNMAMKRLQDGQFDDCDLSLKELSHIEAALSKALSAHYHGRIAYPQRPDLPQSDTENTKEYPNQNNDAKR